MKEKARRFYRKNKKKIMIVGAVALVVGGGVGTYVIINKLPSLKKEGAEIIQDLADQQASLDSAVE